MYREWHSTNDIIPATSRDVLVVGDGDGHPCIYIASYYSDTRKWLLSDDLQREIKDVTYWMEMPTTPDV